MNTTNAHTHTPDLAVTQVLAELLERLERSQVPVGAEQYRSIVRRLADEFRQVEAGPMLGKLLDAYPAAAQVYENTRYQHAGLCRSSLDASLASELAAKRAIARAKRNPETDTSHG